MSKKGSEMMDLMRMTVQDCIELYEMKNVTIKINDGEVVGFEHENIPTK